MAKEYSVNLFTSFTPELEYEWTGLEDLDGWSPFQSYFWLSHWQKTVGNTDMETKPRIITIKTAAKTIAVFPLGIRSWKTVKVLEWLGGVHADYKGPILHKDCYDCMESFTELWKQVTTRIGTFDVIHLERQPILLNELRNPFCNFFATSPAINAFSTKLSGNWQTFYDQKIKKKSQADSRRQRTRLEEKGKLSFRVASNAGESLQIIEKMIYYKRLRYAATQSTDYLASEANRNFYIRLPFGENTSGLQLHVSALFLDEEILAAHVGVVYHKRFFYLMPSNDNIQWKPYSVGRLLLENLLQWSVEAGMEVFDFTVGGEEYKKNWCDNEITLSDYLKPVSLKGWLYVMWIEMKTYAIRNEKLKTFLKKIYHIKDVLKSKKNIGDTPGNSERML